MKKIISVLLSALLIIGCVAISATANTNVYTIDDVASIDNYVAGSWENGVFEEHERRIATNGYVAVDASKTYTLIGTEDNHSNLQFYLAEFDADKNCVAKIGRTVIAKGTYSYVPSSANVAYIALTITIQQDAVKAVDTNGIFNRFINKGYGISMVADGESGGETPEPESSTVTTTTTTTTPVDTEDDYTIEDVAVADNWVEGQYNSLGKFATSTTRACVKKLIKVDAEKTYVLNAKNAGSKKYVVREYDADRKFLQSVANIVFGSKYTPTDATVAYIALTMYEGAPYADIAAGVILPSMVEYVESTTTATVTTPVITPPSLPGVENLSEKLADTSDFSLSSIGYTEQMLVSYNIGNCFEMTELRPAYVRPEISNIQEHIQYKETMAGNVLVTEEYIKYLKSIGIQAIRLPVTWFNMLEDENGNIYPKDTWYSDIETRKKAWYNGKINEEFLARVKQVVDWIIENDMYCMINTHHDAAVNTSNPVNPIIMDEAHKEQTYNYLTNIWGQVGSYFKNYGSKLMFEFYNETASNTGHMTANDTADDFVSNLLCHLIPLIRSQGSNNANRFLVCPRYGGVSQWRNNEYLHRFLDSDTAEDKIIITTHTYVPCSSINSSIKSVRNRMDEIGIGAIIDEIGATDAGSNLKEKAINAFASIREASDEYKVSVFFWDGGHQDAAITNRYYMKPSAPVLGAYVGKDIEFENYTKEEVLNLTQSTQPNWVELYTEDGSDYAGKYLLLTSANKINNLYKSENYAGYYSHDGAENGLFTYFTSNDGVNYNLMSTNVPTPWTKIAWKQLQVSGSNYYTKQIGGNYKIEKIGDGLQNYAPTGSNLVAGDWQKGYYATNGKYEGEGTTYYNKRISLVDKIQVTPDAYYAFETIKRYKFIVRAYNESGNFVSNLGAVDNGVLQIPKNACQISVSMYDTGSPAVSADELLSYLADGTLKPAIYLYSPKPEQDGPTTDLVSTLEGASIRLNKENGMRFYAKVNGDISNADEIGIIIAPKDKVGNYFTMDDDYAKVVYDHKHNALWEGNQYVGSIVNLKSTNSYNQATGNLARDFIARAYVVIDGVTYYAKETTVRNLASVADEFMKDTAKFDALATETQALVDKWAKAND